MQHEQNNFNQYRTLIYIRILYNILVDLLNELFTVVPMNYIFSIGPSLYFNPNLLHINTIWEQVQVQIQALGLSDKCVLANLWYESNKQPQENFPSLNQSVLAAISVLNYERQRNQSKDLARGTQISQEGFVGMLIISGCLWLSGQESRMAASYHQLTR